MNNNGKNIIRQNAVRRLGAGALSLSLLLGLAACGSSAQTQEPAQAQTQTQETVQPQATAAPAPAEEPEQELTRADGPSDVLRGIFEELTADYSQYGQTKAFYTEYYPDVEFIEELDEEGFRLTVQNDEYGGNGSWAFADEGDALTITLAGDDYNGMSYVLDVVDAVSIYYGMGPLAVSYVNGLAALGINNDDFSMTENADGTISFRIGTTGVWEMKELDQMILTEDMRSGEALDDSHVGGGGAIGKLRYYYSGSVDSLAMLFYEYEGLDDVAYQSIINAVKVLRPNGWESFTENFTALESVETDEYTVTIDPDEDDIFTLLDEIDGLYQYILIQFGEPQDNGGWEDDLEIEDSMLSGEWRDEVSQRAAMDVLMYSDGSYDMTIRWGSSAFETAMWQIRGWFQAEDSGTVLSYDDGHYTVISYEEDPDGAVIEEATTQGSITLQEDGKLLWHDSQAEANGHSEGSLFVQEG